MQTQTVPVASMRKRSVLGAALRDFFDLRGVAVGDGVASACRSLVLVGGGSWSSPPLVPRT
jgi:hypothetical protein